MKYTHTRAHTRRAHDAVPPERRRAPPPLTSLLCAAARAPGDINAGAVETFIIIHISPRPPLSLFFLLYIKGVNFRDRLQSAVCVSEPINNNNKRSLHISCARDERSTFIHFKSTVPAPCVPPLAPSPRDVKIEFEDNNIHTRMVPSRH